MLATIVLPMKWKCAHSNQSGRYMLATIVLLKKCKYALTKSQNDGNMSTMFVLLMKL